MKGQASANPTDLQQRIDASLANWKRKLLDLTRRNRALNFKPTKVSTVAIVDEQPAEVFRHLYLQESSMRFKADPSKPPKQGKREEDGGVRVELEFNGEPMDFESDGEQAMEFVPYDPTSIDEKHRDDWLQTNLAADALDHSLRRIEESARTAIEEQGVNTLFLALGMLQYRESRDSDAWVRAPLVLLPVALMRKSARTGFSVSVGDEDAIVNPALLEYLRSNYGIALPDLPDSESISDDYDLQEFLKGTTKAIAGQPGWVVQTDMYLGLFSFQKLVMFKDLEANVGAIGSHRLVRQLLSRAGSSLHGLPHEIRELPLDRDFTPESTYQVVDADSSQMRAAAAVVKGHDIVIEGPPGTGKSQTITNLVAQALAAGKSVLFVAEKMAALDVVHRRLVDAGLGEFCLELHSSKANKRAVMKELSTALDASLLPVASGAAAGRRLPEVRGVLAEYVKAVHEPWGALGKSPFLVAGVLGLLLDAPKVPLKRDIDAIAPEVLAAAQRALSDLAIHAAAVGEVSKHPWRDTSKTLYTEDDLDAVAALSKDLESRVAALLGDGASVAKRFGVAAPATLEECEALTELADVLEASPGVRSAILQSEAWNSPPRDAAILLDTGRKLQKLHDRLRPKLTDEAFETPHAEEIAFVEQKSSGIFSFLAFLNGRHRAIKRRWTGYRKPGYSPSLLEQANDLKQVDQASDLVRDLNGAEDLGRSLFGDLWRGATSDWDRLDGYVAYVVRYRGVAIRRGLAADAAGIAEQARPDVASLRDASAQAAALRGKLAAIRKAVGWPDDYLETSPVSEIGARVQEVAGAISRAPGWAAFEGSRQRASDTVAKEVVDAAMSGEILFDQLVSAFLRAFYMKWMSGVVHAREPLHRFDTLTHEAMVREFRELDHKVLRQNRAALIGLLRDRAQSNLQKPEASGSLPKLQREMVKQRRISPLRRTLRDCNGAIRAIKPCFMMSPLTVAQYLDGSAPSFDMVIFDEASQLPTEDAVGAIVRGAQLVVVGDPKQLPPTNFFSVSTGTVSAPIGDDGSPLYEDSESVLEEFMGAAVPMSRLKWHYRSAHESLISFSNVNFYDADLHTFPSVVTDSDTAGLQFHFVEGGVYEGKGVNIIEARRIADEVVAFAKEQLDRKAKGEPSLSLGVGTLNLRQQLAILDELEVRRRDDPSIEPFFDRSGDEPFFVKNLENIQGDERDAIFLSITYGPSPDGRIRYNFGPLNRENGWRRLNVLVTRARRQMRVFSSMRDHDINPTGAVSDGPRLLREFLAYAEHRRLDGAIAAAAADAESPFEADVAAELIRRGVRVQPQVGVSGYRIDLGVLDDEAPGRFVCGIECDGVGYHSMETVRDRDRLRQQVLEDRGWIIHRVWSTDWFKDRQGQIERLLALITQSRESLKSEVSRQAEPETEQQPEPVTTAAPATVPSLEPVGAGYSRPVAADYEPFDGSDLRLGGEILAAPAELLAAVVARIVDVEGPVHEADVISRIAELWGTKAGSRIQDAIRNGLRLSERSRTVARRGPFYWRPDGSCRARSRSGTGVPGDRIAPEEFAEAIKLVLAGGQAFPRQALITETRAVMGYNRTGALLEQAIGNVVDALVAAGILGEGSRGLILRQSATGGDS